MFDVLVVAALILRLGALADVTLPARAVETPQSAVPADRQAVDMLLIGSPHFANPGHDAVNPIVDDVLTPERQQEIEKVIEHLAAFRPTRVMVERPAIGQDRLDRQYADYRAGHHVLGRGEDEQIGFRLAARLGLPRIDAVDSIDLPPGDPVHYDYPAWLKRNGRSDELEALLSSIQQDADEASARQRCEPVGNWLREMADPHAIQRREEPYRRIATFGDAESNPGAAWVGTWYARNLKIHANILRVATAPTERVVVIFGAGHVPLLHRFAHESGTISLVDARRFLPPAAEPRCQQE